MKYIVVMLIGLMFFSGCKDDEDRTSILGGWNCEEFSEYGAVRTYQTSIIRDEVIPTYYKIYNFHKIGNSENNVVRCEEGEDGNLIIDLQIVGNVTVSDGVGIVASDFSSISWEYTYSDGIVSNELVRATYY